MKIGQTQENCSSMCRQQSANWGMCPETRQSVSILGARPVHQITEKSVGSVDGTFELTELQDINAKVQLAWSARPALVTKGDSGEASPTD